MKTIDIELITLDAETIADAIKEWNEKFDEHLKLGAKIKKEFKARAEGEKGQMTKEAYEALQNTFAKNEQSWKHTGFLPFKKWFPEFKGFRDAVKSKTGKGPWLKLV